MKSQAPTAENSNSPIWAHTHSVELLNYIYNSFSVLYWTVKHAVK